MGGVPSEGLDAATAFLNQFPQSVLASAAVDAVLQVAVEKADAYVSQLHAHGVSLSRAQTVSSLSALTFLTSKYAELEDDAVIADLKLNTVLEPSAIAVLRRVLKSKPEHAVPKSSVELSKLEGLEWRVAVSSGPDGVLHPIITISARISGKAVIFDMSVAEFQAFTRQVHQMKEALDTA